MNCLFWLPDRELRGVSLQGLKRVRLDLTKTWLLIERMVWIDFRPTQSRHLIGAVNRHKAGFLNFVLGNGFKALSHIRTD